MDIFFNENKGVVKIDKDDINKQALSEGVNKMRISAIFSNLPSSIIIDSTNTTSFADEYLLNSDSKLEIIKEYTGSGNPKVYIKAKHPTNSICSDLLSKKISDYKKILDDNNIVCENRTINAIMRNAIWSHFEGDLQLQEREIDTSNGKNGKIDPLKTEESAPLKLCVQNSQKLSSVSGS